MNFSILALVLFIVTITVAAWGDQGLGESDLSHRQSRIRNQVDVFILRIVVKNNFRLN